MKIKIKRQHKVSFKNIAMVIALFCVASSALLEHVSIPIPAFSAVKFPLLYVGGICILTRAKLFLNTYRKKKYFFLLLTLAALCVLLLLTAYFNRDPLVGTNPMRTTVRLVLYLVELFLVAIWIAEEGRCKFAMNFLFWYVLILVAATDFLFFTRILVFNPGKYENYLVGTKFSVAYMHMNLLTLWFIRNNLQLYRPGKAKRFILLGIPLILAVAIRVNCMTGVVGCLALFLLFLLWNTRFQKNFMYFGSPVLLWGALIISVVFPFIAERIVSIPVISYVVENLFERDATLTGRLAIFRTFIPSMREHWLWGYGYGNGNAVSEWLFRCANAQNAQLQWILQAGLPVMLLLNMIMTIIIKQMAISSRQKQIMPMAILVYVYIFLGMVETTFSLSFFLWVACIFMHANEMPTTNTLKIPDQHIESL